MFQSTIPLLLPVESGQLTHERPVEAAHAGYRIPVFQPHLVQRVAKAAKVDAEPFGVVHAGKEGSQGVGILRQFDLVLADPDVLEELEVAVLAAGIDDRGTFGREPSWAGRSGVFGGRVVVAEVSAPDPARAPRSTSAGSMGATSSCEVSWSGSHAVST